MQRTAMDRNPHELDDFEKEIAELEQAVNGLGHRVAAAHESRSSLGFQAEWHIRGILYHLRRVYQEYRTFVHEVTIRAGTGASVLVMYAPSFQRMLFEFYALVNLCRISLDNLRLYLAPLFKKGPQQLPKSVRDVLKGSTDCPVYRFLNGQPVLEYLLDLRNCLVHYRSFATSDNAFVVEEGMEAADIKGDGEYFAAMARADFRRVGDNAISVNVCMPDRIFETEAGGKLAKFTYEERWNLLSMAKSFSQLAITALTETLHCLETVEEPSFTFSSGKSKTKNSQ
jgi:hypothetical protein